MKQQVRKLVIEKKKRIGERSYDEIRPIDCKIGVLPRKFSLVSVGLRIGVFDSLPHAFKARP